MPKPRSKEKQEDYMSRCIPVLIGEGKDKDQAVAICSSMWQESRKKFMDHEELVKAIQQRQQKDTEFNFGILTADRYINTIQSCVGPKLCDRYASTKDVNFDTLLKRARNSLTYSNQDMVLEEIGNFDADGDKLELPKNYLMVFRHVLTTPRKDRDGDILRTKGATLDPKMLLLWQHLPTMPIGKMLRIHEHTSKRLSVYSAIVDINDLSHDAAVMVDNKMGRFSHGFRALSFTKMKEQEPKHGNGPGFEVHKFEVIEESLVSVPANIDSDTEEVILSNVGKGKMTSGVMKAIAAGIKEKQTKTSEQVVLDLDEEKPSTNKGYIDGSYEDVSRQLMQKAHKYFASNGITPETPDKGIYPADVYLVSTFKDHAIFRVYGRTEKEDLYYKVFYKISNGEVEFTGTPKEVKIKTTITEKGNIFFEEDNEKPKSTKSIGCGSGCDCDECSRSKDDNTNATKSSPEEEDEDNEGNEEVDTESTKIVEKIIEKIVEKEVIVEVEKAMTVEQAMQKVLIEGTVSHRKKMLDLLKTFEKQDKRVVRNARFKAFLRK